MSKRIDHSLIYKPTEKQIEAHCSTARYLLFGG